ncbi:MAG: lysoplasmalogenase family protein [Nocardioides sp.]|uniref:lysoplasmalogenase family protein n=1 Tax=Nocardioides sp. TaxID=35761 RepID=UPI003F04F7A3
MVPPRPSAPAVLALATFSVVTVVHLVAQLVAGDAGSAALVADLTQVALMPALAAVLLTAAARPASRLVRLAALALFFSWLGDTLPRLVHGSPVPEWLGLGGWGGGGFLMMVAGFWCAQVTYAVAFWPYRSRSLVRDPVALGIAGACVLGLAVLVARSSLPLVVPVVLYACALVLMALLAPGVSRWAGRGAALFVLSDALIGLRAFAGLDWLGTPAAQQWGGFVVMATYVAGQALLVLGVLRRDRVR